jgi:hypothetical protein
MRWTFCAQGVETKRRCIVASPGQIASLDDSFFTPA